jgi:hypothetical protein
MVVTGSGGECPLGIPQISAKKKSANLRKWDSQALFSLPDSRLPPSPR